MAVLLQVVEGEDGAEAAMEDDVLLSISLSML